MLKKYKKEIIILICLIFILIIDIYLYLNDNKKIVTFYSFNNNIDYKVYLKENDYFKEEYIKSNNQYVSNLINYINVSFNFWGNYSNKITGEFYYTVTSSVKITDNNTDKKIFTFKEELFTSNIFKIDNSRFLQGEDSLNIDYNKYNDIVTSFLNAYELSDFSSYLIIDVKLFVKNYNKYNDSFDLGLEIPLNKKSIGIEIVNEDISNDNNYFYQNINGKYNYLYLIIFIFNILLIIILLWKSFKNILILYFNNFKRKKYSFSEINIILKKYGDFINEVENFDFSYYTLVNIKKIEALIDIKDTINQPLFMFKDKNLYSIFTIGDNNLLYIYYVKGLIK